MSDSQQREQAIFDAALELPLAERCGYLDWATQGDRILREHVASLLKGHEASDFLEQGAASDLRQTIESSVFLSERPGDRIGRYKLLQQIGEGGCGVVYVAEQEEPVRRRVALKIIKLGMDTKSVIARFEAERQALALMEHPNIAKVFDAGATVTGRPYFVMELVRGMKITSYCDQVKLSVRARLEMFSQVCDAVHHAHQKGIIHRDIKPSNILVTVNDGVAVPKVIDFGIAKATGGQKLTAKTIFTAFDQFIGTPAYMSPEQTALTSVDIDTRSDIYGLGVLLYEILAGRTPFDEKDLLAIGVDEMRRTIREMEPDRPSARVSTMAGEELSTAAQRRCLDAPKLISELRGDLDWIVMKCLEKDRARRYETAIGLGLDIRRHLNNEPVVARPASKLYRFRKLCRRNRVAFIATGAVAAALIFGLGIATWMFLQQRSELQRTLVAENNARTESIKSEQVARFLKEMLEAAGPEVARGQDTVLLRRVLDRAAERLSQQLRDQPEVDAELQATIAQVYRDLGDEKKAEAMLREALRLRRSFGTTNELVAGTLYLLAMLQPPDAEALARESLAIRRGLGPGNSLAIAYSLDALANALGRKGNFSEAETVRRDALATARKAPGDIEGHVANLLYNLAVNLVAEGKLGEAETLLRQALPSDQRRHGSDSPALALTLLELATVLARQPETVKLPEAEVLARKSLQLMRKLYSETNLQLVDALQCLGLVLVNEGKLAEAEPPLRERLSVCKTLDENEKLGDAIFDLGCTLAREGKMGEAEAIYREAIPVYQKLGHENTSLFMAVWNLVDMMTEQGRLTKEATQLLLDLPKTADRARGHVLRSWLVVLTETDMLHEADPILSEWTVPGETNAAKARLLKLRGGVFAQLCRWDQATTNLAEALDLDPGDNELWHWLAAVFIQTGQTDAYREHCRKALSRFKDTEDPVAADRIAKDCMILTPSPSDLDTLGKLAETAVTGQTVSNTGTGLWPLLVNALFEYRQGQFRRAVDWTQKVLSHEGEAAERDVASYMIQAMALYQISEPVKARADLVKGRELAASKSPRITAGNLGLNWVDWIISQALLREAQALIEPGAASMSK